MTDYIGYWATEAPVTPEQAKEDRIALEDLLQSLDQPAVTIRTLEVWVNGRVYEWQRVETY